MANITPKKRIRIITPAEYTEFTQKNVARLIEVSQKLISQIIICKRICDTLGYKQVLLLCVLDCYKLKEKARKLLKKQLLTKTMKQKRLI